MSGKPCCPSSAMRDVKQIKIKGSSIGIVNLNKIMDEVYKLNIKDEKEIKEKLLEKVKLYNYVAKSAENDYREALFEEYLNFVAGRNEK